MQDLAHAMFSRKNRSFLRDNLHIRRTKRTQLGNFQSLAFILINLQRRITHTSDSNYLFVYIMRF